MVFAQFAIPVRTRLWPRNSRKTSQIGSVPQRPFPRDSYGHPITSGQDAGFDALSNRSHSAYVRWVAVRATDRFVGQSEHIDSTGLNWRHPRRLQTKQANTDTDLNFTAPGFHKAVHSLPRMNLFQTSRRGETEVLLGAAGRHPIQRNPVAMIRLSASRRKDTLFISEGRLHIHANHQKEPVFGGKPLDREVL